MVNWFVTFVGVTNFQSHAVCDKATLEFATQKCKHAFGQAGIDLMDGGHNLLDLRFADDILIFGRFTSRIRTIDCEAMGADQ